MRDILFGCQAHKQNSEKISDFLAFQCREDGDRCLFLAGNSGQRADMAFCLGNTALYRRRQ